MTSLFSAWDNNGVKDFLAEWENDSDTMQVQTSGSTGDPKRMQVHKLAMARSARRTCQVLELGYGDTALLCLPVEYISGKMMIVRAKEMGLDLREGSPGLEPLLGYTDEIDFCAMTPLQVEHSIEQIHQIKKLIIGGGAVSKSLLKKISQQKYLRPDQNHIWETYGMTETLSHIALRRIYPFVEEHFTVFHQIKFGTDERDCLWIDDPITHRGILQTNDRVRLVENGFVYLGRTDSVINSGGAKIQPEPLEIYFQDQLNRNILLLGKKDTSLGEKLIAVIEGAPDAKLIEQLYQLPVTYSFHYPKEVYFVPSFVYTDNKKKQRNKTLELILDQSVFTKAKSSGD